MGVREAPIGSFGLHRAFVDAGADLVLTCTFGATSVRLEDSSLAGRARELNLRAVELAREAVEGQALVAGSLGPTGRLFEPYGPLTEETAVATYREQAETLTEGGADLLVLETFFALEEAMAAVEGVQAGSQLPLVVAFSFDQGTRTMMGVGATEMAEAFAGRGVAALGVNCGRSLADTDLVVVELLAVAGDIPGVGQAERRDPEDGRRPGRLRRRPGDACDARARVRRAGRPDRRRLLRLDSRAHPGDRRGRRPASAPQSPETRCKGISCSGTPVARR